MNSNCIYLSIVKKDDIGISEIDFPSYINRVESKIAYSLLFKMFNYLNLYVDIDDIYCSSNGKPYIKNSNIKFNYSHSKNYIACCVSDVDIGIDIEDDFKMSDEARMMYLSGIKDNYRKAFVIKEAYCKLLGDFDDDFFKCLDINSISKNKYEINNDTYDLVMFYEGKNKKINIIL